MSTYAVFGMTRHRALERAYKDVPLMKKGEVLPVSAWLKLVNEKADEIMQASNTVQISEKFDAPHFAREFLELARRSESRDLHIKAYHDSGERNPKTGRPIMRWTRIDQQTLKPIRESA